MLSISRLRPAQRRQRFLAWLACAAIPCIASAQTIRLTVTGIPSAATSVVVIADGAGLVEHLIARQDFPASTPQIVLTFNIPAGGPYLLRAAGFIAEPAYSAALSTGSTTISSVPAGNTVDALLPLSPLVVTLDPSTPSVAILGSAVTLRVNCDDRGGLLAARRADFITGPDGASGTGYFGTAGWIWNGSVYTTALTTVMPSAGTVFSFRASTPLISLNIGTPAMLYLYAPSLNRFGSAWQISLTAGGTIRVTVQDIAPAATGIGILIDGGLLPVPIVAGADIAPGTTSATIDVGVAAGGPYRIRAAAFIAQNGFGSLLRTGQVSVNSITTGVITPATVALLSPAITLDPSTPASAVHGQSVTIRANVTDPGDLIENKRSDFLTGLDGASGTGFLGQAPWVRSVSTVYQASISVTMPATGTIFYFRSSTPLFTVTTTVSTPVYLFAPSLDRYGAGWQILLSVDATVRLTIGNIPVTANSIAVLIDGGSLTVAVTTRYDFAPGITSTVMNLGVIAGATYRLRAVAFIASGTVSSALATGKTAAAVSTPGVIIDSNIALSALTVALDPSSPSSAPLGSSAALRFNVSDAGDLLEGKTANFLTGGDGAAMDGLFGSATLARVGAGMYQAGVNVTLPAVGSAFAYRASIPLLSLNSGSPTTLFVFAPALDRYAAPWSIALTVICSYTLAPQTAVVGPAAGSGAVNVTASQVSCPWNASSNASWLAIDSGMPPAGSATLTYIFSANSSTQSRTASITVGGQSHTVTQVPSCSYVVTPDSVAPVSALGESRTIVITSPAGCAWGGSTNNPAMIVFPFGAAGSGNGIVRYNVLANPGPQPRTGAVIVAGYTVQLTQTGNSSNAPPSVDWVAPASALGPLQTFTVTSSDSNGWSNIVSVQVLVNLGTAESIAQSCYVEALPSAHQMRLMNDAGIAWLGPAAIGQSAPLENSQCAVLLTASQLSGSGPSVTVNLTLQSKPAFTGKKRLYLKATDIAGTSSDWSLLAEWWPQAVTGNLVNRYRLYHPYLRAHLHTIDQNEYNVLGTRGYTQEGISGKLLDGPGSVNGVAAVPFYRLYYEPGKRHFWTSDRNEYVTLIKYRGMFFGEGSDGFVLPSPVPGSIPLYRVVHPTEVPLIHHWTTDAYEYYVLGQRGWIQEGIAGYMMPR